MEYNEIIEQVASTIGLSKKTIDKIYKAYWRAIREHVSSLPLKEDLSEEEFSKLQPNVNIPSIGKLHVTYDRYKRLKKQSAIISQMKNAKSIESHAAH